MDNQFYFSFQTNPSVVGETHFIEGNKYLCCSIIRSGFVLLSNNAGNPFLHLLVPDDNSILANSILNNPDGGDFFTISFSDLKFQSSLSFLGKNFLSDTFCVKDTSRVKKITEKELDPFQTLTFKVISQKKTEKTDPGTYDHELEIEPLFLGIEGLPEISRIVFSFDYVNSLANMPWSLMKTKLYNSKLLTESAGKTFTMKVKFWNIGDIDNGSDDVLTFSSSEYFDVDSFQEKIAEDQPDSNSPNPNQPNSPIPKNNNSASPGKGINELIIGFIIFFCFLSVLILGFLAAKKKKKKQ